MEKSIKGIDFSGARVVNILLFDHKSSQRKKTVGTQKNKWAVKQVNADSVYVSVVVVAVAVGESIIAGD